MFYTIIAGKSDGVGYRDRAIFKSLSFPRSDIDEILVV